MRYMMASIMPHARLQLRDPTSISRTSASPALLTLIALVNVSTIITPTSTSSTRSMGSSTRLNRTRGNMESYRKLGCQAAIAERIETKLLSAPISSLNPVRSSIV
jgi:hypothetical protein